MHSPTQVFVITPSFNAAETIERTIVSVLSQAGEFDLIYHVQDGGSTDGTVEILRKWEGLVSAKTLPTFCRSIRFSFDSRKDNGLYDAIVRGFRRFKISEDDWMSWINADDLLMPGSLAILALIDATPAQRHMKWICGTAGLVNGEVIVSSEPRPLSSDVIKLGLADGKHWSLVQQEGNFFRNVIWRKIAVEKQFASLKFAGEWNLWRLMAQNFRLYQIDRPLGLFRLRADPSKRKSRSEHETEVLDYVSAGKRLQALRGLLSSEPERPVLKIGRTNGEPHFHTEPLAAEVLQWLQNRIGPWHDASWQFPAITEQQAFKNILASFPVVDNVVYFGFPWATLIDRLDNKTDATELLAALDAMAKRRRPAQNVITVCQHVRMMSHRALFEKAGVTHIFWAHASRGVRVWPGKKPIPLLPFPLYPVQVAQATSFTDDEQRPHLFSFAGAGANNWYLSEVRNWIIRDLTGDPRGVVIGREDWHYNKIVYHHQIKGMQAPPEKLIDQSASDEFKRLLRDSTFALCPSGSGPNSIRLWEAIGAGSIPVILADSYAPPGDMALWEEAAVFCPETEEAVRALPDRLAAMAADPTLIARKRHALRQLWMLYGPDNFIHDLRRFAFTAGSRAFAEAKARPAAEVKAKRLRVGLMGRHSNRTPLSYAPYAPFFADRVEVVKKLEDAEILVTGFDIDFRENMETVARLQKQNPRLKLAVISEEPLWDTLWAKGFREQTIGLSEKGHTIRYAAINHTNSDIYDFDALPYFITTTDEFAPRYNYLFSRNAQLTPEAALERWQKAPIPAAFYAEKRVDPRYAKAHPELGIHGLSGYRSELASLFGHKGVLRVGQGWSDAPKRQSLPDWHLDKLASLDGRTLLVSAIENTHQRSYVTEKLFDAFAVGGVPLYWAAKDHGVHRLVAGGFLNLHGKSPKEAAEMIGKWKPDLDFAKAWLAAQRELAARFSDPLLLARERSRLAGRVIGHLERIARGDWPELDVPVAAASPQLARVGSSQKPVIAPAGSAAATGQAEPGVSAKQPAAAEILARKPTPATSAEKSASSAATPAMQPTHIRPAAPARKSTALFAAASVVETVNLAGGYRHINIRLTGLAYGGNTIKEMYFKVQHLREERYGLQFVKSDTSMEKPFGWTDDHGTPLDRLNVFFGEGSSLLWSANPGPQLEQLARSVMTALPDILNVCDFASAKIQPDPWMAALAAAERVAA